MINLPSGTRYAILTKEGMPKPNRKTGRALTEEELAEYQRVRPIVNELLQGKGLINIAEDKVHGMGLRGPLEDGWQQKLHDFVTRIPATVERADGSAPLPAQSRREVSAA